MAPECQRTGLRDGTAGASGGRIAPLRRDLVEGAREEPGAARAERGARLSEIAVKRFPRKRSVRRARESGLSKEKTIRSFQEQEEGEEAIKMFRVSMFHYVSLQWPMVYLMAS